MEDGPLGNNRFWGFFLGGCFLLSYRRGPDLQKRPFGVIHYLRFNQCWVPGKANCPTCHFHILPTPPPPNFLPGMDVLVLSHYHPGGRAASTGRPKRPKQVTPGWLPGGELERHRGPTGPILQQNRSAFFPASGVFFRKTVVPRRSTERGRDLLVIPTSASITIS